MGFNINKEITTKLTWEDVALLSVCLGNYISEVEGGDEVKSHAIRLQNRLGNELYNCKQEEPNGH
jgi:hypothetical protein